MTFEAAMHWVLAVLGVAYAVLLVYTEMQWSRIQREMREIREELSRES